MSYFHTTMVDHGSSMVLDAGGHYEALDRDRERNVGRLKTRHGDIVPSSDIPEVCVSGSPEAALFAVIHGSGKPGVYHIYQTDVPPDYSVEGGLDFHVIEEHRYDMSEERVIEFNRLTSVNVSQEAIGHVELAYKRQHNGVDGILAEAIKEALAGLVGGGGYRSDIVEESEVAQFEDTASAYGVSVATKMFGEVPEGVNPDEFDA